MNKEEIKFYSIGRGNLNIDGKFYYGLDYEITDFMNCLQNQVEKLTQENNDLEELLNKQYQDGYIQGKFNNEMKVLELQSVIDKALNKIDNMFNNGDEDKVIDDLLELDKILRSKDDNRR